jgi:hypothetical protein
MKRLRLRSRSGRWRRWRSRRLERSRWSGLPPSRFQEVWTSTDSSTPPTATWVKPLHLKHTPRSPRLRLTFFRNHHARARRRRAPRRGAFAPFTFCNLGRRLFQRLVSRASSSRNSTRSWSEVERAFRFAAAPRVVRTDRTVRETRRAGPRFPRDARDWVLVGISQVTDPYGAERIPNPLRIRAGCDQCPAVFRGAVFAIAQGSATRRNPCEFRLRPRHDFAQMCNARFTRRVG